MKPAARPAAAVVGLVASIILLAPRPGAAQLEERGDSYRIIRHLRAGEPVPDGQGEWVGTRWIREGKTVFHALAQTTAGLLAGLDPAGGEHNKKPLTETYQLGEDADLLQKTFYANFYFPTAIEENQAGSQQSGSVRGTSAGGGEFSWKTYLEEQAPILNNPHGKAVVWQAAALGRFNQLDRGLHEVIQPGQTLPELEFERGGSGEVSGTSTGSSQQRSDAIGRSAGETDYYQKYIRDTAPRIAASNRVGHALPKGPELAGMQGVPQAKGDVESPAQKGNDKGLDSALAASGGTACASCASMASSFGGLGNTGILSGLLGRLPGGIGSFLSGAPFGQALSRFGSGGLGNLGQFFSPDQFLNNLTNRFGSGGMGGGGGSSGGGGTARPDPRPDTQVLPPEGACAGVTPNLSADGSSARDIADFIDLPRTPTPWLIQYRPVAAVVGTQGMFPNSGIAVTVETSHFPEQECLWTVVANVSSGKQIVAFISDVTDGTGRVLALEL